MSFEIAKAGWLHRQSSILKRWKRNWFVLYQDGNLKYFDNPDSHVAEEATFLPVNCVGIVLGKMIPEDPPAGFERQCMFQIKLRSGEHWTLCADTIDDLTAWQMSVEQARAASRGAANNTVHITQTAYPGSYCPTGVLSGGYPGHVIAGPGQTVVYPNGSPVVYPTYGNNTTYVTSGVLPGATSTVITPGAVVSGGTVITQGAVVPGATNIIVTNPTRRCYHRGGLRY